VFLKGKKGKTDFIKENQFSSPEKERTRKRYLNTSFFKL